jgi:lysine 2,3-aminomutase
VEDLRTSLQTGLDIEKHVRGHTAGFNTPSFVVDTMGGGGKRDGHSYEYYDRETGIAVFTSPSVKPGAYFLYFDPLRTLDADQQERWHAASERKRIIDAALDGAATNRVSRQSCEPGMSEPRLILFAR